jgi:hypothetical protein
MSFVSESIAVQNNKKSWWHTNKHKMETNEDTSEWIIECNKLIDESIVDEDDEWNETINTMSGFALANDFYSVSEYREMNENDECWEMNKLFCGEHQNYLLPTGFSDVLVVRITKIHSH